MRILTTVGLQPKVVSVGFPSIPIPYLDSWIAAIRFTLRPLDLVREGISKSKNGLFRISMVSGEFILVTDRQKVAEYLKQPDNVLNMQDGSNDASLTLFVCYVTTSC